MLLNSFAKQKTIEKQEFEADFSLAVLRALFSKYSYNNHKSHVLFLVLIELCHRCDGSRHLLTNADFESIGARFQVCGRTVRRWLNRYLHDGALGLIAKKASGKRKIPIRGRAKFSFINQ